MPASLLLTLEKDIQVINNLFTFSTYNVFLFERKNTSETYRLMALPFVVD